jgi:hypothetical protein
VIRWAQYEDTYELHEAIVEVFDEAARMHWNAAEPGTIRRKVVFSSEVDSDKDLRAEVRVARAQARRARKREGRARERRERQKRALAEARDRVRSSVEPPLRVRCLYCGAQSPTHRCPTPPALKAAC